MPAHERAELCRRERFGQRAGAAEAAFGQRSVGSGEGARLFQNHAVLKAENVGQPCARAEGVRIERGVACVQGHVAAVKDGERVGVAVQAACPGRTHGQRMMREHHVRSGFHRGAKLLGRGVEAHGEMADFGTGRGHLNAGMIPVRHKRKGSRPFNDADKLALKHGCRLLRGTKSMDMPGNSYF